MTLFHAPRTPATARRIAPGIFLWAAVVALASPAQAGPGHDAMAVGDESGLGNAIAQVGLAGLLPLMWVRAMARDMLATGLARHDPGAPWLASWLVFWVLTFLFSASSQGVGGNALGFMALALYLHPASGNGNGQGAQQCA